MIYKSPHHVSITPYTARHITEQHRAITQALQHHTHIHTQAQTIKQ